MAGAPMPSARRPDSCIVLSDPIRSCTGTDAPAIRDDEPLSEFTSETTARSNVEASVTSSAGSTGLKGTHGHLLNFTVHERTSIPSTSPARLHASARRELFESLTAQVTILRARVARMPTFQSGSAKSGTCDACLRTQRCRSRRNCNWRFDHVVRHCPAVNNRPTTNTGAGTGTRGPGDGTARIASRCALGAGKRQSSFNVATTRDCPSCCHERPPKGVRESTRQTVARGIDTRCHP